MQVATNATFEPPHTGWRAVLHAYFSRATVPVLAVVALVLLMFNVEQVREILADVVGRIVIGAPEYFGRSYRDAGLKTYAGLWVSALLLGLSAGLCLLALEPAEHRPSTETVGLGSLARAAGLLVAVLATVHLGLLLSAGNKTSEWAILTALYLVLWAIAAVLALRSTHWLAKLLSVALQLGVAALLVWMALTFAPGAFSSLPYFWGLRPEPGKHVVDNALTPLMLWSAVTPQLATALLWWQRERLAKLRVGAVRRALVVLAVLFTALVFMPWPAAYVLMVGSLSVAMAWLAWVVCTLSCIALLLRWMRIPPLLIAMVAVVVLVKIHREKIGFDELPAVQAPTEANGVRHTQPAPIDTARYRTLLAVFPGLTRSYAVSVDGGGLRAAMFTALVLATADDLSCGEFGRRVRVVSGVSGGSLGVATWIAMRQEYVRRAAKPWKKCWDLVDPTSNRLTYGPPDLANLVQLTLQQDHLSVPLFGTLTRDLLPRKRWAERGQYLLNGWQDAALSALAWQDPAAPPSPQAFAVPLSQATGGLDPAPLLAFNTTDVDSGRVVSLTNYPPPCCTDNITDVDYRRGVSLANYPPLLCCTDMPSMSIGAAALNSARFPLISPAGLVHLDGHWRRVVDGGYFDNTGAIALQGLKERFRDLIPHDATYLRVNGNPDDAEDAHCTRLLDGPTPSAQPASAASAASNLLAGHPDDVPVFEGSSAVRALDATRKAHGQEIVPRLEAVTRESPGKARASPLQFDSAPYYNQTCPAPWEPGWADTEAQRHCYSRNFMICFQQSNAQRLPLAWHLSQNSGFLINRYASNAALRLLRDTASQRVEPPPVLQAPQPSTR
ncbi:MAG: patatin-like phospholipase family protein [Burkholderiaceae bacterium]